MRASSFFLEEDKTASVESLSRARRCLKDSLTKTMPEQPFPKLPIKKSSRDKTGSTEQVVSIASESAAEEDVSQVAERASTANLLSDPAPKALAVEVRPLPSILACSYSNLPQEFRGRTYFGSG